MTRRAPRDQTNEYLWPQIQLARTGDEAAWDIIIDSLQPVMRRYINEFMADGFERANLEQAALEGLVIAVNGKANQRGEKVLWDPKHPKSIENGPRSFVFYAQLHIRNQVRAAAHSMMTGPHVPQKLDAAIARRANQLGKRPKELADDQLHDLGYGGDARAAIRGRMAAVPLFTETEYGLQPSKAVNAYEMRRYGDMDPTEFTDQTVLTFLDELMNTPEHQRLGKAKAFIAMWGLEDKAQPEAFLRALERMEGSGGFPQVVGFCLRNDIGSF